MPKPALGKGLGALIPKVAVGGPPGGGGGGDGVMEIELSRISPNEFQPRKSFTDGPLEDLAASIRSMGVIQPVVVRKKPGGGYELIAGERRYRASSMAGLKKIPAIIKDVAPVEALELALIENIQREELNPIETAEAFERLIGEFGLRQDEMAEKVGKDRSTVSNFLRLLELPADCKRDMAEGTLSMGHAKAILSVDGQGRQLQLRREILTRGLSVREAEAEAKRMRAPGRIKMKSAPSAQVLMLEDELKRALGTKVHIKAKGRGGAIVIEYYSSGELERLLDVLRG